MLVRHGRQHKRPVVQQQIQTALAAGGAAVVQRSDAIDGGSIDLQRFQSRVDPRPRMESNWGQGVSTTNIGSSVDQRSHTGHVSRQAGLMKGGHMINGANVSRVTLQVTTTLSFWSSCARRHTCA